ncbi:MAG: hypothetical protein WC197_05535 [Candidatus Gastranaerophilaceae bacterium]|jgi:hypothetical protein
MVSQPEFEAIGKKFDDLELRGSLYPMFTKMVDNGLMAEAFIFILTTWNSGRFRMFATTKFDYNEFTKLVEKLKPFLNKFKDKNFETIHFDDFKEDIKHIYSKLSVVKGVEYTGAAKAMHLGNREVFVMWDENIRRHYGFKKTGLDYLNFLKKMQVEFKGIKKYEGVTYAKSLAKCIDEYNYITYTLLPKEKNKKSSGKSPSEK